MEILDLRHLSARDLEPLLEEEKVLWRDRLQWDYTLSAGIIKRFADARSLPGFAAMDGGKAVGFSFFVYEDYKGLIGDVFVSDSCPNGGAALELLTHVVETIRGTPGVRRIETQLMNFGNRPIGPWLRSRDFQSYRRKFMCLSLDDCPAPVSRPAEVRIVPWDARWFSEAVHLITQAYESHVDSRISDHYRTTAGAGRFLDNLLHYPGCGDFQGACSVLAFPKDSSQPCGMLLASQVGEGVGHITQLCVAPHFRGLGVGYNLVCRAIQSFCRNQFRAVTLTVTESNRRAVQLYEQLGFVPLREFDAFAWESPE